MIRGVRVSRRTLGGLAAVAAILVALAAPAHAQAPAKKPNILVIFGDDVGQTNISAYAFGVVGYRTPNIDRIARDGMMFTDYYAENSCTAGRSSFITGQTPKRTGLSKVGIPGAPVGLQARDITIARALKAHGYATGQFGKNHLGDRDEFLPTRHGFDEFFGNLYHLNAEEEPERPYWPKSDTAYVKANSPRGVLHTFADGKIDDTGPLNRKRMETIDDETTAGRDRVHDEAGQDRHAVLHLDELHAHARLHPRAGVHAGPERHARQRVRRRHDRDGRQCRQAAEGPRRSEARRRHHRRLHDRQRPEPVLVARCGDHALPLGEGHQLGGCVPRTGDGALAGQDQARTGRPTRSCSGLDWFPTLLAAAGDPDGQGAPAQGLAARRRVAPPTRSTWTATTSYPT